MTDTRDNIVWGWLVPALVALSLFFSFTAHLRVYTGGLVGPGEVMMALVGGGAWLALLSAVAALAQPLRVVLGFPGGDDVRGEPNGLDARSLAGA